MGRPEPCVLFAQTFVHPQLDEYVDEVIFAEPIVVSACEFLEQNASSAGTLVGATSPPSFALEVFVQCEGDSRFRRLCQPFLYSHSSSNVLEVEAVVTNHLVVRGSYRSLSLVIYGNTAEDLGQFNIEFDLDSSLTNLVSPEAKLEDLPLPLHSNVQVIDDSIPSLKALSLPIITSDISIETKQLLQLLFKIIEFPNFGDSVSKVVNVLVKAVSSYITPDLSCKDRFKVSEEESQNVLIEARNDLLHLYKSLQAQELGYSSAEVSTGCSFLESETDLSSPKQLMELLRKFNGHYQLSQNTKTFLFLGASLLLCSGRDGIFHFVNGAGVSHLSHVLCHGDRNSTAMTLMLLAVVEKITCHSIGCEGFLGWWPREDENVPSGVSEGYSQLVKLLLRKQRHDIASLATYLLHRLRFYEVACRYEHAVLSILGGLSAVNNSTNIILKMLISAQSQLKRILNLINARGPIDDPSPVACASRSVILGRQTDGSLLSYKATSNLIASSKCQFSDSDIDPHLLSLLKERGFLPLSAALLSSSVLHSEFRHAKNIFMDLASSIGAVILSLLFCRSGLIFLLLHPELSSTLILALVEADDKNKDECLPLRYAYILISKGFFCHPREVGVTVEMHMRAVVAIDKLLQLKSTPQSEELLWVLWELCGLSRSDCGREALLALVHFPEAVSVLVEALHCGKDSEHVNITSGAAPLNLAIFHSAAEIVELIVTDSTASSLECWIKHANELHRALHSSSPGSNRKDAPARLLEWIDAGVVYRKNGALGLLRYAALLASGGDAHLNSTSILVSDSMDVDTAVRDDIHVLESLGKLVSEKSFDGVALRDSSVAQLTTAFRILAFISENPAVAAVLYDEGAITVIYVVLVNCRFMLERSSNSYDYLVDEGTEVNSTSDLLLERNREQSLVALLIPSLALLITLLQKLQEAKEQHRNTKLMNALLRLHQEVSPKLAASASDLSSYPDSALGFGAVCHLLVSSLACWPVYGWTPGLFHSMLDSVQSSSLLALGPKETCSLLCLLNDLFPEEGVWLWKNGMPSLSAIRTLAIGTLLGPRKEGEVEWYLRPQHLETLLSQLTPQLDKIAQIFLHYAISALVVVQDMLRVFIIRIACQSADRASTLIRPIISLIFDCLSESSSPSETDTYKIYRLLDFLASLLEHPRAKPLLLMNGAVQIFAKVLGSCITATNSESRNTAKNGFTPLTWCIPVLNSLSSLCDSQTSKHTIGNLSVEDCSVVLPYILKLSQVLPVGRELLACLFAFKELGACNEAQSALASIFSHVLPGSIKKLESETSHEMEVGYNLLNEFESRKYPPLLCCWIKLLRSIDAKDSLSTYAIEAAGALSLGALHFCIDRKSVSILKYLFGIPHEMGGPDTFPKENINYIQDLTALLSAITSDDEYFSTSVMRIPLSQVKESTNSLLLLLQNPIDTEKADDLSLSLIDVSLKNCWMGEGRPKQPDDYSYLLGMADKFLWECPETLRDSMSQPALPVKRKASSLDGQNRRARIDGPQPEITAQGAFSRGLGPPSSTSTGLTRRDTFRQRKPNTSRPPSMHVDDYVARERNDGVSGSNIIAVQRTGSTSGRPPSIHVDEFMARQRERQNPVGAPTGEAVPTGVKPPPENEADINKSNKSSKQIKPDSDDELQGIDIVFEGVESDPEDKLPFPRSDDVIQQPASVTVEQNSPRSIVEETETEVNENSQFSHLASNVDENSQSEFSSRKLTREQSVTSDKRYSEQSDDMRRAAPAVGAFESVPPVYNRAPVQLPVPSPILYPNNALATGPSQGLYDQKYLLSQPPLPPMPPPPTVSSVLSQTLDSVPNQSSLFVNSASDVQPLMPSSYHVPMDYQPTRPQPPLPPTPPPFPATTFSVPSLRTSTSQPSYPPPPLMPPLVFSRPSSIPSLTLNLPLPQPSSSIVGQLQPLQPPQLPRPPQPPPQHLRPPTQASQQPQVSPMHHNVYYQTQNQENFSHLQQQQMVQQQVEVTQPQVFIKLGESSSQQQQDSGMSLQEFFSSPEAIQSLLSDRDKLCQLLEQHPKLMQMLQEKLGHL